MTKLSFLKHSVLRQDTYYFVRTSIGIIFFITAAIISTYLYFTQNNKIASIYPGIVFTSSTILTFLITKKRFPILHLLSYYFLMTATYYGVWILTLYSSYLAMFCGIVTAGIGSLLTFILTDKYITKIQFKRTRIFIIGGLAFLITDILCFSFNSIVDKAPIQYFFNLEYSADTLYGEVIFIWQILVGTTLVLKLNEK